MTGSKQEATATTEQCDALVIGANLAGLVIAYYLSSWGYSVRILERGTVIGGIDRSFQNRNGRNFDFGVHSLDYMRSEFTTRLMIQAVDSEIIRMERKRGIVHRGTLIPYNADKSEWPAELSAMMPEGELVDELGTDPPTRENLGRYYGQEFADYIFEETLASYPAESRHLTFGVDEWELMTNIYPWFFPRARRMSADIDASRIFHDRARAGQREDLVYPKEGGFGAFAAGFARKVEERGGEIVVGAKDLHIELDPETRDVRYAETGGRRFGAPRVYWCGSADWLGELLSVPCPETQSEVFVLGSFEFESPISCEYTEILFGDPDHFINRASFPGKFSGTLDNLVQLEFAYPRQSDRHETSESYWLEKWTASLQDIGVVQSSNPVVDFDLKVVPMMYNSFGVDGVRMPEVDFSKALPETSNLRPVLPTIRKININTRLPQYLEFLTADLLGR